MIRHPAFFASSVFGTLLAVQPARGGAPAIQSVPRDLPLAFEVNQGQSGPQARFLARGEGFTLFLTRDSAVLSLRSGARQAAVRMRFSGAAAHRIEGLEPVAARSHYLIGRDANRWRRNVGSFARVRYSGVYPGIDLIFYGNRRQLEFDLAIAPGADPSRIRLDFEGVQGLRIGADGDLVLDTAAGEVRQRKPRVFQESGATRREISGEYVLPGGSSAGFRLSGYNPNEPLRIDPVLVYSSFLGGNGAAQGGADYARAVAVDAAGNIYVAGTTESASLPTTPNAFQKAQSLGPKSDAFVAKFDPSGQTLIYATYLGGDGYDDASGIAVDAAGNAYVVGYTNAGDFPVTAGAFQPRRAGGNDAFVTELNASGSALVFSSFLGGSGNEGASAVAVDAAGAIYVAGTTASANFPTTPGTFQPAFKGGQDAFVAKIAAGGGSLVFSTFLGGSGNESATSLAVAGNGATTVAGWTESNDYPVKSNALRKTRVGRDGFISTLDPSGSSLAASTLVGGSGDDAVNAVALDAVGNIFAAGSTASRDFAFPKPAVAAIPTGNPLDAILVLQDIAQQIRAGSYQGGDSDAFLLKLKSDGTSLLFGGYLGGAGSDAAYALAPDASGNVFAGGRTNSADFPVSARAAQTAYGGGTWDGFVAAFSAVDGHRIFCTYSGGSGEDTITALATGGSQGFAATGYTTSANLAAGAVYSSSLAPGGYDAFVRTWTASGALIWSGYLGGSGASGNEQALSIAVDRDGNLYVAGVTASTNFPVTTGAIQSSAGGAPWGDAYVTKIDPTGTRILYSTYLGGSGDDSARGIAVDGSGNAYVAGASNSSDFPTTSGALQERLGGGTDAFVAKLSPNGDSLVYSTLLGGPYGEQATAIAVDGVGNAYVTGYGFLYGFPTTPGVVRTTMAGSDDIFVSKLSPGGALVYSTLLGGEGMDWSKSIAVDSGGNAYVTGTTNSATFPVTAGAFQTKRSGSSDAFVAKLNPTATSLSYATYAGGAGDDTATAIAVDGTGNAVVGGFTSGTGFPVTAGALQSANKGSSNGFVARLKADGSGLTHSTLLGGNADDGIAALAIGADGRIFVTGWTSSYDFPATQNALQSRIAGQYDAMAAVLNRELSSLDYASPLGGGAEDRGTAIAVDGAGDIYLGGYTSSADFPVRSNAFQPAAAAPRSGFVTKLDLSGTAVPTKPSITQVSDYYSGRPAQAPGEIVSIEGSNLAGGTVTIAQPAERYTGTLPTSIAGTSVRVGGQDAFLFSVSPGQIVAQLPYAGNMQFTVTAEGVKSDTFAGSFATTNLGIAGVYREDLSAITQDKPLKPGDTVVAYITGAGTTTPASMAGTPTPSSPTYNADQMLAAQVETDEAGAGHFMMMCDVKSVSMAPGLIGIAAVRVLLNPQISSDSIDWDFSFATGSARSNKVRIYIYAPAP